MDVVGGTRFDVARGWDLPGYYAQCRWWRDNPPMVACMAAMAGVKRRGHRTAAPKSFSDFIRSLGISGAPPKAGTFDIQSSSASPTPVARLRG